MDLVSLLRIMVRWWIVVVPILVLTVVAAVLVNRSVDPVFEAAGSVLVAPPGFSSPEQPFGAFDIGEIAAAVREDDSLDELRDADELTDYTIDDTTDGLLQVIATGTSGPATEATADAVAALVVAELVAVQEEEQVDEAARVQPRLTTDEVIARQGTGDDGSERFVANVGVILDDSAVEVQNPYGPTPQTGRLLQVSVMSAEGQQRVRSLASQDLAFEIFQDWQDRAPILGVSTYGPSSEGALEGFEAVTQTLDDVLDERQERAGVPPGQRVLIEVIAAPGGARDVSPPVSRAVAVTVALGLVAAVGAALAIESVSNHRRLRGRSTGELSTDDPAEILWPSPVLDSRNTPSADQPQSQRPRSFP